MEIVLGLLLVLFGGIQEDQANPSFDRFVQAALLAEKPERAAAYYEHSGHDLAVILPRLPDPQPDAPSVRGIYVTSYTAGGERMAGIMDFIEATNLNAVVIDVKEDAGLVSFHTDNEVINNMGSSRRHIRDIHGLLDELESREIYSIARIVVFKDNLLANKHPEWSFLNPDGSVWLNRRQENFVNPYVKEIWDYNIEVAKEAARAGFKEIQFDYVRFPEGFETREDQLTYVTDQRSRIEAVNDFVRYAQMHLNPLGVRVSVDIFGYAASVPAAEGIGQDFIGISENVEVISPMVYPSHYGPGWYGNAVPDAKPYETILGSMLDTLKKLEPMGDKSPIIRPWLQSFTATWISGYIPYGAHEIEEQIRALHDAGLEEYLLWNPHNRYTEDANF